MEIVNDTLQEGWLVYDWKRNRKSQVFHTQSGLLAAIRKHEIDWQPIEVD